jgi:hypothetical protein
MTTNTILKFLRDHATCFKVTRALYGTIDAPRFWNHELANTLTSFGYKRAQTDWMKPPNQMKTPFDLVKLKRVEAKNCSDRVPVGANIDLFSQKKCAKFEQDWLVFGPSFHLSSPWLPSELHIL